MDNSHLTNIGNSVKEILRFKHPNGNVDDVSDVCACVCVCVFVSGVCVCERASMSVCVNIALCLRASLSLAPCYKTVMHHLHSTCRVLGVVN